MANNLTIAHSVSLCKVLESILFSEKEGKITENDLPFNVKYKIQRNLDLLNKDRVFFESEKQRLITLYGKPLEDNPNKIEVTPENLKEYKEELLKVLSIEVSHNFRKLKPEEVESIKNVSAQTFEMDLFIALMVEDKDFENDLNTPVVTSKENSNTTETTEK